MTGFQDAPDKAIEADKAKKLVLDMYNTCWSENCKTRECLK